MEKHLTNILFIFPVMAYYALEAVIVGIFIMLVWNLFLRQSLGNIGYFQIIGMYWIIKMLLFNVFNLITSLSTIPNNVESEEDNEFEEEND